MIPCRLCGRPSTDTHHLMNGANRHLADEDGLVIRLCRNCHVRVHSDAKLMNQLRAEAQTIYETTHTHEEWMARYGRNYL